MTVLLHGTKEVVFMRQAGRFASELLDYLAPFVKPGISTGYLDDLAVAWTSKRGLINAPLNYKGTFPKSICTSLNEVVCHGIPSENQILKEGDILNIDVTPKYKGWHGDTSRMFGVGEISKTASKLISTVEECLALGISEVKPGAPIGNIGAVIQEHAEKNGFSVVRDFVGHGVGREFHSEPSVFHFGKRGSGLVLKPGMIFTIEPMINEGTHEICVLDDEWTAVTADGKLSAQVEHTVCVTKDGVEVLTK